MTWFKVDDTLHAHKKAMRAGTEAMGLWVLAGSWAADQLTDGWVPQYAISRWSPIADELAGRLVYAGLWIEGEHDGDKGWWFHEWEERQPTRADVRAKRQADAERRARWREQQRLRAAEEAARAASQPNGASQCDTTSDVRRDATVTPLRDSDRDDSDLHLFGNDAEKSQCDTTRESQGVSALPDPTRPDPVLPSEVPQERAEKHARRKRPALPLPDTWRPNANHTRYARDNRLNLDHEADQFRANAASKDRRQANWDAAFRQWLGNTVAWRKPAQLRAVSGGTHAADPDNGVFWEQ